MRSALLAAALVLPLALLAPTAAAGHICYDAPQLPGALSQFYDMWNNVFRYYTCHHVVDRVDLDDIITFEVLA